MSVNITYKNNTLITITDGGTKILKTAGKYMEDDVTITDTSVFTTFEEVNNNAGVTAVITTNLIILDGEEDSY